MSDCFYCEDCVQGMRADWTMAVDGLMSLFRVLPRDLYRRVMETDEQGR